MRSLLVFLIAATVGKGAAAPQFQLPPGINAARLQVCPNFPFCATNNAPEVAQATQAAATGNGGISSLLASAQQLASNPAVPAQIRVQIAGLLATASQPNSGAVLPQIQSQLNAILSSQATEQTQNLPPQLRSQIDDLVSSAQQILPQQAPAAAQAQATAAASQAQATAAAASPNTAFAGLVGPNSASGLVPSGFVGPARSFSRGLFGRKK